MHFQISPRKEKQIRVIKIRVLEKFPENSFTLSEAEHKTSCPLSREGIVDLPLLKTLLAICQKLQDPSLWEKTVSFILLT